MANDSERTANAARHSSTSGAARLICTCDWPVEDECPRHQVDAIVRADRYNVVIEGHAIPATDDQERRIRAMDAEQRARFLTVMGRT